MARRKTVKKSARRKVSKTIRASAKIKRAAQRSAVRAARGARLKRAIRARKATARPADRLVLYGLHFSLPSCKVGLMLSLCGANFDYKHVDLMAGENKRPEFLAKNRFGQVPVLQDGSTFLCQSNVILQYLADKFGRFGGRFMPEAALFRAKPSTYSGFPLKFGTPQVCENAATARHYWILRWH